MPLPEILGLNGITPQGTVESWSYNNGSVKVLKSKGPRLKTKALYDALKTVSGFNPVYDSIEHDPGRGIGTVIAVAVEDAATVYELLGQDIMKPLAQSYYYAIDTVAGPILNGEDITQVMSYYDSATTPSTAVLAVWDAYKAKMRQFLADMDHGILEVPEAMYVLRETKTVSKRSHVAANYGNVNRVCSPPDVSAVNSLIAYGDLEDLEWLKKIPTTRTYGKRKWQMQTEWWGADKWSGRHYGGSWNPQVSGNVWT